MPEGGYYTLTWTVPPEFGGMTTVVLERSAAFARQDRRRVDILTLSPALKDGNRESELKAEGRIGRGVHFRNLWHDLLHWPDRKLRTLKSANHDFAYSSSDILPRTGTSWVETREAADGTILQTDRYRSDGTLLLSDRQDVSERGRRSGRRLLLFDRHGDPVAQWSTARSFYHSWLDAVFAGRRAYLISDSSFVGGLMHDYRRENVVLCQVIHNHFLKNPGADLQGELTSAKSEILTHIDSYDLVTTLTEHQCNDMYSANLATNNLRTVSNSTRNVGGRANWGRKRTNGAMIARLAYQKRVEDAVRAIATASETEPGIHLDIYGDGDERDRLLKLRTELNATSALDFHGHVSNAKAAFKSASFSVLTSRFEGQGLAILESMAAGCIPIAYDIPYGPADIIDHGVNGFLVRAGDVDELASTLTRVTRMSRRKLKRMRENALIRASDYFQGPIVERWGEVLNEQTFVPITKPKNLKAQLSALDSDGAYIQMSIRVSSTSTMNPTQCYVVWTSRSGHHFGRYPGTLVGEVFSASIPTDRLTGIPPGLIDFSMDFVAERGFERVRISTEADTAASEPKSLKFYPTAHGNLSARILKSSN